MALRWPLGRPPIPGRAVAFSVVALAVPVVRAVAFKHVAADDYEVFLWLLLVVPAFLMAYYRGWRGAVIALALGMVLMTAAQVWLVAAGRRVEEWQLLGASVFTLVAVSLAVGWGAELLHQARAKAEELAVTDELTGLPNRRFARMVVEREFAAAQRGRELVLVIFDLDNFKRYNDLYGHECGDEALCRVGQVLAATTRRMNLSARYGGEEFVSVVSGSSVEGALVFVERVQEGLRGLRSLPEPVTVSAGVAPYHAGMASPVDLVAAADAALYEAKLGGRDRVRVFGAQGDPLRRPERAQPPAMGEPLPAV